MNYKGIFVVDTVVYSSGKYEKLKEKDLATSSLLVGDA